MPLKLNILVATMTGTAGSVAQTIELAIGDAETEVRVIAMDGRDASVFEEGELFLICSSTYGQGDVPDNAKMLYDSLRQSRPDLSHVRYGVIALGDRTYADTFCMGGRRFDQVLSELGAQRVGEMLQHDASSGTMPEEVAEAWIRPWVEKARASMGAAA